MPGAFAKAKILIGLEPGRLTVSVVRGGAIVRTSSEHLSPVDWAGHWEQGLRTLHEPLERAMARVRAEPGDRAVILFESPQSTAEMMEVPARGSEAVHAARLAISDRVQVAADSPCIAVRALGEVSDSAGVRRSQLIVVASEESVVQRLTEWAERVSLRVIGIVPASGALLSKLADDAARHLSRGEDARLFAIDRHRTVVVSVREGRMQVLRTFEVGVQHIVESLVKGSQSSEAGRAAGITPDRAYELLMQHGLPHSANESANYGELDMRSVLPLLQPVLQRLYVELRQSFRLSGRHVSTSGVVLKMAGAGCEIPGLSAIIADALNVEVETIEGSSADALASAWLSSKAATSLRLTSLMTLHEQTVTRVRKCSLIGAGLGVALLGGQIAWTGMQMRAIDTAHVAGEADLDRCELFAVMSSEAATTKLDIVKARGIIDQYRGNQPDWQACLTEVALAGEARVGLIELRGMIEDRTPVIVVSGVADAGNEGADLNEFIRVLTASALVRNVEVVSRRLMEVDGHESHQFRLRIVLESVDFTRLHAEVLQ